MKLQCARGVQFRNFLSQRFANTLHFIKRPSRDARRNFLLAKRLQQARPRLIGANFKGILSL